MKVLFAVSSENISEAIIKRYQKEYKEILSYKNVYYFNAILKEIQKDKTYDRIVISEDLEPFSNNNYETIDKFIFEKLDSISDEAEDSNGKETSIILICTDRRQKGNSILVKLFGIGVYNALLGNDRSMDEVCRLINKPRNKKEAKIYYRIDTDDVNYKPENENEVSEVEIQNILAHFKKLGRNTAKYSDSFNNIAVQYNDEQLKIIVNCLPINVKAVLESNCERYQELMANINGITSVKNMVASTQNIENTVKRDISSKSVGKVGNISKPIVIPAAVRNAKNQAQVQRNIVTKSADTVKPIQQQNVVSKSTPKVDIESKKEVVQNIDDIIDEDMLPGLESFEEDNFENNANKNVNTVSQTNQPKVNVPNVGYQRPRRPVGGNIRSSQTMQQPEQRQVHQVQQVQATQQQAQSIQQPVQLPQQQAKSMQQQIQSVQQENNAVEDNFIQNDINDDSILNYPNVEEENVVRRGRGRPRKTPVEGAIIKEKGKRGRPRKIQEEYEENVMLPGLGFQSDEEDIYGQNITENISNSNQSVINQNPNQAYNQNIDSLSNNEEEYEDEATMLPGMGFEDESTDMEDIVDESYPNEQYIEEQFIPEQNDIQSNTEQQFEEEEYTDEVALPGLDGLDDLDDTSDYSYQEENKNLEVLPNNGEDFELEENTDDGELLPGINSFEEESSLDLNNYNTVSDANVVESIKPKVDYSMSSLNRLITKDKKIVTFIGTSKNGVSFLVNNLATLFSSLGINTAILDMTKNKNSYYIYTKNEDELRNIAFNSIEKLQNGYAEGIRVDKNLSVYTALPNDGKDYSNAEPILSTLIQNHSLVLIDCDYDTDLTYFSSCQEMYLIQSMDILTIQPLTAFLRELKTKGILEPEKIRVVINKELKVKSLSIKALIGGLSYYNDPAMSFMTELFNKDTVKACTIPFEDNAYSKYLEGIVNCNISLKGFSKSFLAKLKVLGDMVYPLTSKQAYGKGQVQNYNQNNFSNSMNDTLNKMRKKY